MVAYYIYFILNFPGFITEVKNSKVFEQKGYLLSFMVNIDHKLSKNAKPSGAFVTFVMSLDVSGRFFQTFASTNFL